MANDWKQLFSEYPILQTSIICQDVTTNLDGQHTYHNELLKIPQKGLDQFILVQIWRGNNTSQDSFYEIIDLVGPDGEILSTTRSAPFQIFGTSYRHYNFFAYTKFVFPKKGTYELVSKLFKENDSSSPLLHENYLIVL